MHAMCLLFNKTKYSTYALGAVAMKSSNMKSAHMNLRALVSHFLILQLVRNNLGWALMQISSDADSMHADFIATHSCHEESKFRKFVLYKTILSKYKIC